MRVLVPLSINITSRVFSNPLKCRRGSETIQMPPVLRREGMKSEFNFKGRVYFFPHAAMAVGPLPLSATGATICSAETSGALSATATGIASASRVPQSGWGRERNI